MLDADDRLHPWGEQDDWFESYWFAFHVPEQGLSVYIYPWFRPHLGLWGGGVFAWDGKGAEPWTMVHNDYAWARRFAGEASMIDETGISTPQGIRIDCLEAARRYRIRYDRPGLVTAQVTENVYDSATGRILLVPQGARLLVATTASWRSDRSAR